MKLTIRKTAKYAVYGNKETAKTLWIVLHGYGQLVDYFIRNFHVLNETENLVIAPEGMHRFYLNGTEGRVGASWMTKEERLDDISDNNHYLDQIFADNFSDKIEKIIVLGFSQGASTAARWIEAGNIKPTAFVLWAGVFPPDVKLENHSTVFGKIPTYFAVGDNDQYFSEETIHKLKEDFLSKGMDVNWMRFSGKHEIDSVTLLNLEREINSKN
ncbi:MAG: dienelactone hydrolase family protein [Crocinitomicaceae bacterium]